MTEGAAFLADRLAWQFRKRGGEGEYTKLFEALPSAAALLLRERAAVEEGEIPTLACYFDEDKWALLTTERLVTSSQGAVVSIALGELHDATVGLPNLGASGWAGKMSLRQLTLVMADGRRHEVELEPGRPFSGFWNVLKTVAASNRGK